MCNNSFKAQQCLSATNGDTDLPNFVTPGRDEPRFEATSLQAIITSYRFNCCGVVTQWRAIVFNSNDGHRDVYDISFQVWRPKPPSLGGNDGCYNLIGVNHFPDIQLPNDNSGILTGTPQNETIEVQPGDVVGFYLVNTAGHKNDGIQFAGDVTSPYTTETVWFSTDLLAPRPEAACTYTVGTSCLLNSFTSLAPLITATVCKSYSCILAICMGVKCTPMS